MHECDWRVCTTTWIHVASFSVFTTNLEFVRDHVSQSLIVDHTKEDVCLKLSPSHSTVHPLISIIVVAS